MSYGIGEQCVGDKVVFRTNNPATWAMTEGKEYTVTDLKRLGHTFISVECDDGKIRFFSPGQFEKE